MIFADAGPWALGEKGVLQRISYALRVWCEENALAPSSASDRLAVGWRGGKPPSAATVDNLAGSSYAKRPQSRRGLPNTQTLWALCDRIGVSAEWIFTGTGPKARRTIAEGGRSSRTEFAQELAAQMVTACADIYGTRFALHCDAEKLLDTVTALVRLEAQVDMSTFGVRQAELMTQMTIFHIATKYAELVSDDHPDRLRIDQDLFQNFQVLRRQLASTAQNSRLPIVQEQFRHLVQRSDEMIRLYGVRE